MSISRQIWVSDKKPCFFSASYYTRLISANRLTVARGINAMFQTKDFLLLLIVTFISIIIIQPDDSVINGIDKERIIINEN